MTQIDEMLSWFRARGGSATLSDILQSGTRWAYEWRARATEARDKGVAIVLTRGKRPSENVYRVIEHQGQMSLL